MMKLTVHTESGSVYLFDNAAMTWSRRNTTPGHEVIRFHEEASEGCLAAPVKPVLGRRLTFFETDDNWVVTTPVVSIEEE